MGSRKSRRRSILYYWANVLLPYWLLSVELMREVRDLESDAVDGFKRLGMKKTKNRFGVYVWR